jgi:hypothetical protein
MIKRKNFSVKILGNRQNFVEVKPGRERVKTLIVKLFLFVFVRSMQSLSRFDKTKKKTKKFA